MKKKEYYFLDVIIPRERYNICEQSEEMWAMSLLYFLTQPSRSANYTSATYREERVVLLRKPTTRTPFFVGVQNYLVVGANDAASHRIGMVCGVNKGVMGFRYLGDSVGFKDWCMHNSMVGNNQGTFVGWIELNKDSVKRVFDNINGNGKLNQSMLGRFIENDKDIIRSFL